jgi:hypothetical protein
MRPEDSFSSAKSAGPDTRSMHVAQGWAREQASDWGRAVGQVPAMDFRARESKSAEIKAVSGGFQERQS